MSLLSSSNQEAPQHASRNALDGRVTVSALPCYSGPNSDAGPKRMLLPQGEFTLLHPACPEIRFCGLLGFPAGVSRGGHYHREKTEFLYVLSGRLHLETRHRQTGERFETDVVQGDLIRILPETDHRLTTIEPGEVLEYSASPHNPADTIRDNA